MSTRNRLSMSVAAALATQLCWAQADAEALNELIAAAAPGDVVELPGATITHPLSFRGKHDVAFVFTGPLRYDLGQAGKRWPVVDMTGAHHVRIEHLTLQPASVTTPGVFCHVLLARVPAADGNEPSAGGNHVELRVLAFEGNKAAALAFNVVALGSEGSSVSGSLSNPIGGNVYVGSGNDRLAVESPHGPVFSGWTSTIGFAIGGEFAAGGAYPNIVLDGTASSVRVVGASFSRKINAGYATSYAPCAIDLGLHAGDVAQGDADVQRGNVVRDCYFEYGHPTLGAGAFLGDILVRSEVVGFEAGGWLRHGVARPIFGGVTTWWLDLPDGAGGKVVKFTARDWHAYKALPTEPQDPVDPLDRN